MSPINKPPTFINRLLDDLLLFLWRSKMIFKYDSIQVLPCNFFTDVIMTL